MHALFRRAALDTKISKHTLRVFDALLHEFTDNGIDTTITISELARRLQLPERTVCRALAALKEGGYIKRSGSNLVMARPAA